jgi:hypothetical protein
LCHILTLNGRYSKTLNVQNYALFMSRMIVYITVLIFLTMYVILGYNGIGSLIFGSPREV